MTIDGTAEADRIIVRRLTQCIRTGVHTVYDPRFQIGNDKPKRCARCGIGRHFKVELVYEEVGREWDTLSVRWPIETKVTLL